MEYKLVVVMRTDIKISPGKAAAQVAHASVTCALEAKKQNAQWFKEWYREGQRKVVVKVKTMEELYRLKEMARSGGLTTALIADAGLTEVPPGTVTCLG
ncbi:MAG: peptidyl-tRNA hydrolase Pth2, partial [Candidatus Thermoplasmatota archaeon]|nr:peptidyl-tRNA hydrolase Pth2 [Candidatus Thermoplasmatota archaeon]